MSSCPYFPVTLCPCLGFVVSMHPTFLDFVIPPYLCHIVSVLHIALQVLPLHQSFRFSVRVERKYIACVIWSKDKNWNGVLYPFHYTKALKLGKCLKGWEKYIYTPVVYLLELRSGFLCFSCFIINLMSYVVSQHCITSKIKVCLTKYTVDKSHQINLNTEKVMELLET